MGDTPLPLRRISTYPEETFALRIVHALREPVGGRTTEVFQLLQNIFLLGLQLSGPVLESNGKLVAARKLSGHPITAFVDSNQTQNGFEFRRPMADSQGALSDRVQYLTPKYITYISRASIILV